MTQPVALPLPPSPQTPVIQPDLVVAEYTGPVARYADPVWPLDPLIANPSAETRRIYWATFPQAMQAEFRLLIHRMINTELPQKFLIGRHPPGGPVKAPAPSTGPAACGPTSHTG